MEDNTYKKLNDLIPKMFSLQLSNEKDLSEFWELLGGIVNFDEAYLFLTNPKFIELKYFFNAQPHLQAGICVDIDESLSKFLFDKSNELLDKSDNLIKSLKLKKINSAILLKLKVKEAVFGFLLLVNKKQKFTDNDLNIMESVIATLAYLVKDLELSEVFKTQLTALTKAMGEINGAYKTIKEQNVKILAADKVKNEFLANISHELRTPLNAIIGFSEILATKLYGELNTQQEEYIKDIQASGIHLLGMINGILDISKIEAKAMKVIKRNFAVDLAVKEVCNIVKPLVQKKQIQIKQLINTDIDFYGDYQKIQQILYNLLSNAIKFTANKGQIIIEAASTSKYLILKIQDNGIGIAKKNHKKIFNKFVQLEDAYTKTTSSTGLGLAITKEFVEMHNGKITLESEVNKGAIFTVKLPLVSE